MLKKTHYVNVICDLCKGVCETTETNAKDARFQASGWGWKRIGGKDLCDVCIESESERYQVWVKSYIANEAKGAK
jgi:hypothetical protein